MDSSFFDVIFYAFIIILVLSSIFKKKPQNKSNIRTTPLNEEKDIIEENENPDVLKKAENIFEEQSSKTNNPYLAQPEAEDYNLSNEPEKVVPFIKNYKTDKINNSNNISSLQKDYVSQDIKILDSYLEKEADKFEKYFSLNKKNDELIIKNLKAKITNKNLLKEYFIISEILGKPKALRR